MVEQSQLQLEQIGTLHQMKYCVLVSTQKSTQKSSLRCFKLGTHNTPDIRLCLRAGIVSPQQTCIKVAIYFTL